MTDLNTEPAKTALADDSGLRCPQCAYNLTGLPENVCPECGAAFDPDELRRRLPQSIPGWERPGVKAFLSVCMMTWGQPALFASRFPACYSANAAAAFRRYAMGLALLILVPPQAVVMMRIGAGTLLVSLILIVGLMIGVICFEVMISGLLDIHYPQRADVSEAAMKAGSSWAGLIGFYRSFLPLTASAVAATVLVNPLVVVGALTGVSVWWLLALLVSIIARLQPAVSMSCVAAILMLLGLSSAVAVSSAALPGLLLIWLFPPF